ncbi:MAG TPA: phosphate ABC transporter substrate-binding protein PstS [Mucilaginibacter sp.]|jgi:phosphate transport system substrate-binding protein
MKRRFFSFHNLALACAVLLFSALVACNGADNKSGKDSSGVSSPTSGTEANTLLGAGSSFVYPLFSKIFAEYNKETGVRINYQSIGSGGGILQLTNKTIDFGDSDAPLNDEQTKKIGVPVLHIPMCSGAVVISYNLPDFKGTLKLDPDVLADIFLGKVTKWNDPRIVKINSGQKLPETGIFVAHRSDGSGTTNIFTTYLSKVSSDWDNKAGKGSAINWPVGIGGKGNEGVAGLVKQTPGAIGYIELAYAIQNKMPFCDLKNKSGNYITPSVASTIAAGNIQIPDDAKVLLSNTDAKDGYPISGFTWAMIYKEQAYNNRSKDRAEKLVKLLSWNIHDGQKYCNNLDYAKLSPEAVTVAEKILKSATYNGEPILK